MDITDPLATMLAAETKPLKAREETVNPMAEDNDELPTNAMDEYPEYWIG